MDQEKRKKERLVFFAMLSDRTGKVLCHTLFIFFLVLTIFISYRTWNLPDHKGMEKIFYLLLSLITSFCTAFCFITFYLPFLVEKFTDVLLSPKRHLSKPAPLLSPVRNLITLRKFYEAEEMLTEILARYPADPCMTFALAELYFLHIPDPGKMETLCRNYFENGPEIPAPENIKILLLYTDTLLKLGKANEAVMVLKNESGKKIYPPDDLAMIQTRLAGLDTLQ